MSANCSLSVVLMREQLADQVLVKRVQDGDKTAFNLLVTRYQNRVASLVARYVATADVADIVQETFIRAYRALSLFRNESAFYTWLYRIAVNTAKNYLASQIRRPSNSGIDVSEEEQIASLNELKEVSNPENLMLTDQLKKVILQRIEMLPTDLKMAITLRELEGLSYEEIAEIMECPIGTVRSRIFRAREAIDEVIRPLLEE